MFVRLFHVVVTCNTFPSEPKEGAFQYWCSDRDKPTTYDVGGVCTGACALGYEGTLEAKCTAQGTWDVVNKCTPGTHVELLTECVCA